MSGSATSERRARFGGRPLWRRRLISAVTAYVVLLAALGALGLDPSPPLFAAFFVAALSVSAFVGDRLGDNQPEQWPSRNASTFGLGRGADHQATALARRLAAVGEGPPQTRANLARELHTQLGVVVADRVQRRHGRDILSDPGAARELLPPDLAQLVLDPPDERRLTEPASLSHLLDRIESL
jgi:hypothetical protein